MCCCQGPSHIQRPWGCCAALWNVTGSHTGLAWKGDLGWSSSTSMGRFHLYPRPAPAWPWTLSGMEQPQKNSLKIREFSWAASPTAEGSAAISSSAHLHLKPSFGPAPLKFDLSCCIFLSFSSMTTELLSRLEQLKENFPPSLGTLTEQKHLLHPTQNPSCALEHLILCQCTSKIRDP